MGSWETMNTNNTSVIALIGISAHEVRVMQTICLISKSRSHSYVLQVDAPNSSADIVIVDQDNPDAIAAWKRYQAKNQMIPVIMLSRRPAADSTVHQLGRPLMATRLLNLLDQIPRKQESPAFTPSKTDARPKRTTVDQAKTTGMHGVQIDQHKGIHTTALVVDDSLPVRQQIKQHLAPLVGRVELAEDGEQALRSIERRPYDIIFLDVVLPGMDGYKICREIRRNKSTKRTPVIMLTGKSSPFDMVKGKLAGCDTYLTKPVEGAMFLEVVQKYLKKSRSIEFDEDSERFTNSAPRHI
jgi:twitching motility two-component system response regulator PilG